MKNKKIISVLVFILVCALGVVNVSAQDLPYSLTSITAQDNLIKLDVFKSEAGTKVATFNEPISNENYVMYKDRLVETGDKSVISTLGGATKTNYLYTDINNLSDESAIPMSGAAYQGLYLGTEYVDGIPYFKVNIGNQIGYMKYDEVQIIPIDYIKGISHYENNDGIWTYYEAYDGIYSDKYQAYPLGDAPSWAEIDVNYYTLDDVHFYTNYDDIMAKSATPYESVNYFQNLPFRSASNYTAEDYDNYLEYKGKTDSAYYGHTQGFIDAQNEYNLNSLMLFAFANHESAYGTSSFAKSCNNFFGRGAFDSNPENACASYGFDTPEDGIIAQAAFLNNEYFDVTWYTYNGTNFGNKNEGMNVYYASDVDWGVKIASHLHDIDSYLGGNEEGLYTISKVDNNTLIYNDENKALDVQNTSGNVSDYTLSALKGNSSYVNVISTDNSKFSDKTEIQLPTQVNVSNSSTCSFTRANNGAYPDYDAIYQENVSIGTASYACDYDSFEKQEGLVDNSHINTLYSGTNVSPSEYLNETTVVVDNAPTLTFNIEKVELDELLNANIDYIDAFGVQAIDDVDGDITNSIVVDDSLVNYGTIGNYTVTFSVTDSGNNTTTETKEVDVIAHTYIDNTGNDELVDVTDVIDDRNEGIEDPDTGDITADDGIDNGLMDATDVIDDRENNSNLNNSNNSNNANSDIENNEDNQINVQDAESQVIANTGQTHKSEIISILLIILTIISLTFVKRRIS